MKRKKRKREPIGRPLGSLFLSMDEAEKRPEIFLMLQMWTRKKKKIRGRNKKNERERERERERENEG